MSATSASLYEGSLCFSMAHYFSKAHFFLVAMKTINYCMLQYSHAYQLSVCMNAKTIDAHARAYCMHMWNGVKMEVNIYWNDRGNKTSTFYCLLPYVCQSHT